MYLLPQEETEGKRTAVGCANDELTTLELELAWEGILLSPEDELWLWAAMRQKHETLALGKAEPHHFVN